MKLKERDKESSCGVFWEKCDRKRRNTFIQIGVVTLLMIVTFSVSVCQHLKALEEESEGVADTNDFGFTRAKNAEPGCSILKNFECAITCTSIDFSNEESVRYLYDSLEEAKEDYETCKLFLQEAEFENSALEENWIVLDPDKHPKITELLINRGNLNDIKENSFASLTNLVALTISFTNITSLRRSSFQNLSELKNLQFSDNPTLQNVENGILQNFKLDTITVQRLEINGETAVEFFRNLTGDAVIKSIRTVDWSYNNLKYFPKTLLQNTPNIEILSLIGSSISEFEKGSFGKIRRTENVFLGFNRLARLPEEIFREVVEKVAGLFVMNNQLICDCDMEWLQKFVIQVKNYTYGDFQNVLCSGPDENTGVPFLEADMCPGTTPPPIEPTTTTPSPPETEEPTIGPTEEPTEEPTIGPTEEPTEEPTKGPTAKPPEETVVCDPYPSVSRSRRSILPSKFRITPRSGITIHLPCKTLNFTIEEEDGEVRINLGQKAETSYNLLYWKEFPWHVTTAQKDYIRCISNIPTNIKLPVNDKELNHETDYVFCIFNSPDEEINILNCDAFKTQPSYSNQPWLTNRSIPLTSYLLFVGAALFMITGASTFYFLVRKNPSLIRGSKRVIVVKRHNKAQVMVLPSGYTNNSSISDTSKYTLTDSSLGNSTALSISGDTMSTASYVSALQPTPIEIFTYRLERLQALTMGDRSSQEEEEICRTPPPLPPYPIMFSAHQGRLPPNVDLLFEYEWYTTTTTTTTS